MSLIETPEGLLEAMQSLRTDVLARADDLFAVWQPAITRPGFDASARNLACYLGLRRHDLRGLQINLMRWGLSSLGRSESRVRATLDAVIATLGAICRLAPEATGQYPDEQAVFKGGQVITEETDLLFGAARSPRRTRILVTVPAQAADDLAWMQELVKVGTDGVRINCAHDSPEVWERMLRNLRTAERELGLPEPLRVLMDLGGPKVRTVRPKENEKDIYRVGDRLLLVPAAEVENVAGRKHAHKHKHKHKKHPGKDVLPVVGCTLVEALERLGVGEGVFIDDGQIGARVVERIDDGVVIQIVQAPSKGRKIRSDKGLNFPDTEFEVASLTDKDRSDLRFVAQHADMIGYSFVQTEADIDNLLEELARCMAAERRPPALVLKIETKRAVRNLPELIVHAAGKLPTAVMIARGDLAIELGFQRIAEMQEEILWLCEAASVPVIWATQVLEGLAKEGLPTRAEVTDAAMASRAECVMLNKGPHIMEAIQMLDDVLNRMEGHQHKKTPQLRVLRSWQSAFVPEPPPPTT
jgi:pyruvate kinase